MRSKSISAFRKSANFCALQFVHYGIQKKGDLNPYIRRDEHPKKLSTGAAKEGT